MADYWVVAVKSARGYQELLQALRKNHPQFGEDLLVRISRKGNKATDRRGDYLLPDVARQILQGSEADPSLNSFFKAIPDTVSRRITEAEAMKAIAFDVVLPDERPGDTGDSGYSDALRDIRVPEAHAANGDALKNLSAVRVGHIDTGITKHPCFGFKKLTSGDKEGWPLLSEGRDMGRVDGGLPLDRWPMEGPYAGFPGHGTRTASVLCGRHVDGSGKVIFQGVAPQVPLVPYRISDTVIIDLFGPTRLDEAYLDALAKGCHVVSLSMGDPFEPRPAVAAAVNALYEAGVIMVCAAGNVIPTMVWPARFERTIAAGGSTVSTKGDPATIKPWAGGSRGSAVDLCAPADKVTRANWQGIHPTAKPSYAQYSGTSYATAQIAGAAALWLAKHGPAKIREKFPGWRTVELFRKLARSTAQVPPGWDTDRYGAGVLDVYALLAVDFVNFPAITPDDYKRPASA